ncbi:MAG: flagellar brake protein [Sedimenticola sp.]
MTENLLNLQIGDVLQLELLTPGYDQRHAGTVIGYVPGKSILVTTPEVDGKVMLIREGQQLAVRMLHGSHIKGFRTKVIHVASAPYPYLHIAYPADIESIAIRSAERVETAIDALARNTRDLESGENWVPVHIQDLSLSGAKILSRESLGTTGDKLELRFRVDVCGIEESLDLVTSLRKQTINRRPEEEEGWRYINGIEIHHVNRFQKVLLGSYLLEQKGGLE